MKMKTKWKSNQNLIQLYCDGDACDTINVFDCSMNRDPQKRDQMSSAYN